MNLTPPDHNAVLQDFQDFQDIQDFLRMTRDEQKKTHGRRRDEKYRTKSRHCTKTPSQRDWNTKLKPR